MATNTILGVKLRRTIITIVNGMARGKRVKVRFHGTRAYTDGTNINLPAIKDLAEIPYAKARALIGYAIHEVAHILYTDFEAILRAIEAGKMEPDKLIKKFGNAIEDYRIEKIISKALPGTASDLTALRNLIHPTEEAIPAQWFADPRACGPLALTWTGSQINSFAIPAMQTSLDAFPAPVKALIDNWTGRMTDVASTEEAVDLAIAFAAEAIAYAAASRSQPNNSDQSDEDDQTENASEAADGQKEGEQGHGQADDNEAEDIDFSTKSTGDGTGNPGQSPEPNSNGRVDMNNGMTDLVDDATQSQGDSSKPDPEESTPNPLADILEDNAEFDDFLADLREQIAKNPLPEDMPDTIDGEVDPENILSEIDTANSTAPNYISPDQDPADIDPEENHKGPKPQYNDARFYEIDHLSNENDLYNSLRASAAGVISTTARTISRLLKSQQERGVLVGRRSGQFDIRNMSAIIRNTGTCYKRKWERPAPATKLVLLTDFSGSMLSDINGSGVPLTLAMTGALAVEEATRNTQIETSIYGFQGWSPHVVLYPFKAGKQGSSLTKKRIGAYKTLPLGCTPTGEAMAAVAEILDAAREQRRLLIVLTDGDADDPELCKQVVSVLNRRGIEVVAIGIKNDRVRNWCKTSHVIHDISQLPQALLSTIDPRGRKNLKKAA